MRHVGAGDEVTVWRGAHGGQLVVVNEGRDIWDVFFDEHMIGNSRVAPCSKQLKQEPCRRWVEAHFDPEDVTIHVGIDWTETHRIAGNQQGWAPYTVEAPLAEPPYIDKPDVLDWLRSEGIEPPRLYGMGFEHANCGGFCVRMGHAQADHLLKIMPNRYAYHERREQEFRDHFGWDVSVLRDRTEAAKASNEGKAAPLTLREFRERSEAQPQLFGETFPDDTQGCATCFLFKEDDATNVPVVPPTDGADDVVMMSSGATSWAGARRVAGDRMKRGLGLDGLHLLFADVKGRHDDNPHAGEDADNYRFLHEAAANVLGPLTLMRSAA